MEETLSYTKLTPRKSGQAVVAMSASLLVLISLTVALLWYDANEEPYSLSPRQAHHVWVFLYGGGLLTAAWAI